MTKPPDRLNFFFCLVIVASGLFVFTILAMIATAFSDSQSPVVNFLNHYGGQLLLGEVVVTVLVSFLALYVDRTQILRNSRNKTETSALEDNEDNPNPEETNESAI
jgi:hypothetical protein